MRNKKVLFFLISLTTLIVGIFCFLPYPKTIEDPQKFIKQLSKRNPGTDSKNVIFSYFDPATGRTIVTDHAPINVIILDGKNITDLSMLKDYSLHGLTIKDSGMTNLAFLSKMDCQYLDLELNSNELLTDYSALKKNKIGYLRLIQERHFSDASLIHPETAKVTLADTGVTTLNFSAPQNLTALGLFDNKKLLDYSGLNGMTELRDFAISGDLAPGAYQYIQTSFPGLKTINTFEISLNFFPPLLAKELDHVRILLWPNLADAGNLSGKKVKNLTFAAKNLTVFKTVKGLEITEEAKLRIKEEFDPGCLSGVVIKKNLEITLYKPADKNLLDWVRSLEMNGIKVKIHQPATETAVSAN